MEHTKSHPLSSVSAQVPSSHTCVRTTMRLSQFNDSLLFKVLTGKESTGNVDVLSRESPKQSRVQ